VGHDDVPRVRTAAARLQGSRVMAGGADRKLAAIMFTDMVGFSAVTQRDAALALARQAVAVDPRDPVAQLAQSWAYVLRGDLRNGLDSSARAVELNPSMPEAWGWRGWIQIIAGDPEAGIASSERARRLSPQGPTVAQVEDNLAMAYFETGRYADALEAGRKLVALRPAYVWGYGYVAMSAAALGRVDEARAAVSDARRVEPRISLELFQRGIGVSRPEIDARRNAALRQAGLE